MMQAKSLGPGRWRVTDADGVAYSVGVPMDDDTAERAIASLAEAEAGQSAGDVEVARVDRIKTECGRRITAVMKTHTQSNLHGEANASNAGDPSAKFVDAGGMAAYMAGRRWVEDMRSACARLIGEPKLDPAADENWPRCPPDVAGLASAF